MDGRGGAVVCPHVALPLLYILITSKKEVRNMSEHKFLKLILAFITLLGLGALVFALLSRRED